MMELLSEKKNCCGCSACYSICPSKAIFMVSDEEGFKYPRIDSSKCIECGLCKKTCAFQDSELKLENNLRTFAAKNKDETVRYASTSGGVFTAISDLFINRNGIIYGVKFDENFVAVHSSAKTAEERDEFRGSKYVQSDINNVFELIKNDLKNNKMVMFTGTPCQCAGLRLSLENIKVDFSNLLLCDIVCHGTPSPLIFAEHIRFLEKKSKSKVKSYACRYKINGWHNHTEKVVYEDGSVDCRTNLSQAHKKIFYSHNTLRPSCHNCKYTSIDRISDITIADFWGIEKVFPDFDDNKGVSLVLINTQKGERIFNDIKKDLICLETSIENCLQPQLLRPSEPSLRRTEFWDDYRKKGYEYIVKKYTNSSIKNKLKSVLKSILIHARIIQNKK